MTNSVKMSKCLDNVLSEHLADIDPELYKIMQNEKSRQRLGLELIASENFTSVSVLQCLSSCFHNKYSEGLPGQRYYGGNEFIDQMELLCQKRCLNAFNLDPNKWGCNVQPLSGSPANIQAYTAIVGHNGRIMGLDLPDGGHLTHGFQTPTKKISVSSLFFESMPYKVNPTTCLIDYEQLAEKAKVFKPNLIIAGISCYSRDLDYKKFREICNDNNCFLLADMAHVSGLVAAGLAPNPFEYADVVTTTTHKTLRGPRAGIIFFRKGVRYAKTDSTDEEIYDLEMKINQTVFPGFQGGPHNNTIAAIATTMLQVNTKEFKNYQNQVLSNAKHMAKLFLEKDYRVVTGGTDNHMLLINLRNKKVSGARAEKILESIAISCNKNSIPGDKNAFSPSGIRLGTPALTTRGFKEDDITIVVDLIDRGILLAREIGEKCGPKLVDFVNLINKDETIQKKISELKNDVENFSSKFPLPGMSDF